MDRFQSIKAAIPDAVINLRYASSDNFAHKKLYPANFAAKLDRKALRALTEAAKHFRRLGLRLVIWDGLRLPEVQDYFLQSINDHRYVRKNSLHLKGLAVDITLIDSDNNELDMGTDFDDFSEKAHVDSDDIDQQAQKNRLLLVKTMREAGFEQWPYEWWHFDYLG